MSGRRGDEKAKAQAPVSSLILSQPGQWPSERDRVRDREREHERNGAGWGERENKGSKTQESKFLSSGRKNGREGETASWRP